MTRFIFLLLVFALIPNLKAQLLLDADGPGGTYDLITSKLAPGYNPIEVPDCGHAEEHIDEIFDADLNTNVFRFHMHVNEDDDRCINDDRQRGEIKAYNQSPDSLLGIEGEMVVYNWKFKIDAGFQSSPKFTHIHQLKAVGGSEYSMPLITLTTRLGTPDEFELRYAESTTQVSLLETDLTPFKGVWCEVTETVTYGENGTYEIIINKVSDNSTLLSYTNNDIRMWRTDADFVRPKWGIYRSLNFPDDLRDEEVLFANFSIEEIETPLPVDLHSFTGYRTSNGVRLIWETASEENNRGFEIQKSENGVDWSKLDFVTGVGTTAISNKYTYLDHRPFEGSNYYRLKQLDFDGQNSYSNTIVIDFQQLRNNIQLYPNPAKDNITIMGLEEGEVFVKVFDTNGLKVAETQTENQKLDISNLPVGIYFFNLLVNGEMIVQRLVKI